ncbi:MULTISPECIES: hypothetical protein [unclassified Rothia (in: high G+C Gram-positive bacteria)]|uniref:hypothetical protein n=1 Tax=unclassified Rothia (in: high G+C Gram-positive bacteria) TaxID=2689056 RepID=UPI00195EE494|nr:MULTISPECIES: hypothetical protein [unclassified Rothia (in: high G+C Gram-positive bacteria)]MBM7050983.1 hypothetical protein [Rothia sp. ZJ1223]QRZ62288.1 hypothetical protein JR346_04075 [Rothia sp. ZJ932]
MVKILTSLKWEYFKASFRNNIWSLIGAIFGGLYALGALIGFGAGAVAAGSSREAIFIFLILFGSALALLWWTVPVVASGADATLDPDRLVPYPLTTRQLQWGQFWGGFIGLPGFITLAFIAVATVATVRHPLVALSYLLVAPVAVLLIISFSRFITLVSLRLRSNRKTAQIMSGVAFVLLIGLGPIFMGLTNLLSAVWDQLPTIARVLGFTPLGAPWAVPAHLAVGDYLLAGLSLVLALIYTAVAWWLWHRQLALTMVNVGAYSGNTASKTVNRGSIGLLGVFPATARGAIAARTVLTLLKDPRPSLHVIMVPALYVIFSVTGINSDDPFVNPVVPFLVPAMAGYVYAYLVSYDNSAFSMHVLAPLRGIDDRLGRAYGLMLVLGPMILIGTTAYMLIIHSITYLPIVLAMSIMMFLNGIGMGALLDMVLSIPTPPPGTSPWKSQRNPDGVAKSFVQMGFTILLFATALPSSGFWIAYAVTQNPLWSWIGVAFSLIFGLAFFYLGITIGAKRFDRHSADALQRVSRKA